LIDKGIFNVIETLFLEREGTRMFPIFQKLIIILSLGLNLSAMAQVELEEFAPPGPFKIVISGLRNGSGGVGLSLYDLAHASSFPTDPRNAQVNTYMELSGKQQIIFNIPNLKPGYYAIAVYHDENGNKNLDTNFIGLPIEGVAVSRNAKGSFGPPNFDAAKVFFDNANTETRITVEY